MKKHILRTFVSALTICLMLAFGMKAIAGPAAAGPLLVQAYGSLERADHDYKGHRIAAMKQIEAAATLLGVNLKGDGKGHEAQGVSDDQLRVAQGLLQQAVTQLSGRPLNHVNRALNQLSIALSIK